MRPRWRRPGSRAVKAKRFKLKRDAVAFMAKVEAAKREGTYLPRFLAK